MNRVIVHRLKSTVALGKLFLFCLFFLLNGRRTWRASRSFFLSIVRFERTASRSIKVSSREWGTLEKKLSKGVNVVFRKSRFRHLESTWAKVVDRCEGSSRNLDPLGSIRCYNYETCISRTNDTSDRSLVDILYFSRRTWNYENGGEVENMNGDRWLGFLRCRRKIPSSNDAFRCADWTRFSPLVVDE